jgi:hypothetical protein
MSKTKRLNDVCSGDFIFCVRIHEDQLVLRQRGIEQFKSNGTRERVNKYEVPGKLRPGLVLSADTKTLLVWYCFTAEHSDAAWVDVSAYTCPPPPKRAFLKPFRDQIRSIPRTNAWCEAVIASLDKAVLDGFLKQAQRLDRNVMSRAL